MIKKAEDAADRTLTAVETMIPLPDRLVNRAEALKHDLSSRTYVGTLADRKTGVSPMASRPVHRSRRGWARCALMVK